MKVRIDELNQVFSQSDAKEQLRIKNLVEKMDRFSAQNVIADYLCPSQHLDIPNPFTISNDTDVPDRLKIVCKRAS